MRTREHRHSSLHFLVEYLGCKERERERERERVQHCVHKALLLA